MGNWVMLSHHKQPVKLALNGTLGTVDLNLPVWVK